ncbi:MAG: tRNA (adenine(22)-N(1))-methyltransferase TrmK [Candidatus Omnitrophica bacterium]|nr:tRNA (adenine(22)-N(1))-methyltransferase TrmK [Candidatus Omnitrophota bacterium]
MFLKKIRFIAKIYILLLIQLLICSHSVLAFSPVQQVEQTRLSPRINMHINTFQDIYQQRILYPEVNEQVRGDRLSQEVESTYKRLFPDGIPVIEDISEEWDDTFRKVNANLGTYEELFYDAILAGFISRHIPVKRGDKVLDFGTGTGVLAIYAALKGAELVVALDVNEAACRFAKWNTLELGLHNTIKVVKSDGYNGLSSSDVFDTIVFAAPPYTDNMDETDIAVRDYKGKIVEMFLCEAKEHLLPGGKVILMYPDNLSSVQRIKEFGLKYGLIITERVQLGTAEKLRSFYRSKFKDSGKEINTDFMREKMTKKGWFSWSVFRLEKIEDVDNLQIYESLLYEFGKNLSRDRDFSRPDILAASSAIIEQAI